MTEALVQTLKALRDVDGIVGSFVLDRDGRLLARDLPQYFDSAALGEVGPRVQRLYEAWQSDDNGMEAATLVFAEHKLHVREHKGSFVAVVSTMQVNMPALKMAMSMVGRRLASDLGAGTTSSGSLPAPGLGLGSPSPNAAALAAPPPSAAMSFVPPAAPVVSVVSAAPAPPAVSVPPAPVAAAPAPAPKPPSVPPPAAEASTWMYRGRRV